MMRIWYDQEGDFLEITFREAKGYMREIAEDIYERVDEEGNPLGYALFGKRGDLWEDFYDVMVA